MAATVKANFTSASSVPISGREYSAKGKDLAVSLGFAPATGDDLMVVKCTGLPFISGRFSNLQQGQEIGLTYKGLVYMFVANYYGGSGNDLVLVWQRGGMAGWGANSVGELGNNSPTESLIPVEAVGDSVLSGKTVVGLSGGDLHGVAVCSDGTVATWGSNQSGQLGNDSTKASSLPVGVTASGVLKGKTVVKVSAGSEHTLALCSDGTIAAWGRNSEGRLGDGSKLMSKVPVGVSTAGVLAGKRVVQVSAGGGHSLALCADGTVVAWGSNSNGQLGNNGTLDQSVPVRVRVDLGGPLWGKKVIAVSAGLNHSLAVCSDGTVVAWGANAAGQLGNGGFKERRLPALVKPEGALSGKKVVGIAAGCDHSLALCGDGTVVSWGAGELGQLGNGIYENRNVPVLVNTGGVLAGKKIVSLSAGNGHSLALSADGAIAAWGTDVCGMRADSANPVMIDTSGLRAGGKVKIIDAGYQSGLAYSAWAPGAKLRRLVMSTGSLSPAFSPDITSYLVSGLGDASTISFTPGPEGAATVSVNGTPVVPGIPGSPMSLHNGINAFTIHVVSGSGEEMSYSVTILKGSVMDMALSSMTDVPISGSEVDVSGLSVNLTLGFAPPTGAELMLVKNDGLRLIAGSLTNLAQGQEVDLSYNGITYKFLVNYRGGDGNDLVLDWAYRNVYSWGSNDSGQLTGDRGSWSPDAWLPGEANLAGKTVSRIAAGESHSLALLADGSVVAWGDNTYGQLGDGTNTSSHTPVVVVPTGALAGKTVIDVAAGASHSVALCLDGTVVCWGHNQSGELGDGTFTDSNVPVALFVSGALSGRSIKAIAAGGYHSLAVCSDGRIVAWGDNDSGDLGNGDTISRNRPVAVVRTGVLGGKMPIAVVAGKSHSLALCSDNTIVAWGANSVGQLGNGGMDFSTEPVLVSNEGLLAGQKIVALAAGDAHNLAVLGDGGVVGWGSNYIGQLGIEELPYSLVPVAVNTAGALSGKKVVAVAAGSFHSLALCSDGTLTAWGYNGRGPLGDGTLTERYVPVVVGSTGVLSGKKVVRLAAGAGHSLALAAAPLSNNSVLTSLGLDVSAVDYSFSPGIMEYVASVPKGTSSVSLTPVAQRLTAKISVNGTDVKSGSTTPPIALAEGETLILVKVTAEDGTSTTYSITVQHAGDVSMVFQNAAGPAVRARAYDATGLNAGISLAFAPSNGTSLTVVENTGLNFITGEFSNLVQGQVVDLGYGGLIYKFVVNYHGGTGNDLVLEWYRRRVASWGGNSSGELGNGNKTSSKLPLAVTDSGILAGKVVLTVIAGARHNLALCSDGTLAAWGNNAYGQLGDGGNTNQVVPVAVDRSGVLSGKKVIAIAAGPEHNLALCSDGTLAAWGAGGRGKLGYGDVSDRRLPVAVDQTGALAGKRVVAISAGYDTSLALCSDGTLFTWGGNQYGQLGDNTGADRNVPAAVDQNGVLSGRIVTAISSGDAHHLALCSDGTLATWGWNYSGQLGDGTQTDSRVPVLVARTGVLSGKEVVSAAACGSQNLCLCSDGTLVAWGYNGSGQLGNGGNSNSKVPVAVTLTGILSGKSVSRISVGSGHCLASCSDGTLAAWGLNSSGQLGDGSVITRKAPVAVDRSGFLSDKKTVAVSAGNSHSVAIVMASPSSSLSGLTLSPGTLSSAFSPGTLGYTAVMAAGSSFTVTPVTLDLSATVKVNGVTVSSASPSNPIFLSPGGRVEIVVTGENAATTTYVITAPTDISAVFASSSVVPVTSAGYDATGWSADLSIGFSPPVGTGLTVINNVGSGFITGQFTNLAQGQTVDLAFGDEVYHFIANYYGGTGNDLVLEWANRSIAAWGLNGSGQLGIASSPNVPLPVAMPDMGVLTGKTVVSIAAGASHSLALCADGTLSSWGGGASNLGAGGTTQSSVPIAVKTTGALAGKRVVGISAAAGNNLAVCADGSVVAWGSGSSGQLGNGGTASANEPVAVSLTGALAGKSVTSVAVGGIHSLALCSDGSVLAWGLNSYGQLGDGTTTNRSVPVLVSTAGVLAGKKVVAVSAGLYYSLALCSDGTLAAWGDDSYRQLGSSLFQGSSMVPKLVDRTGVLSGETVVALSQAAHSTPTLLCASGRVVTWGLNDKGQRGSLSALAWKPDFVDSTGALAGRQVVSIASGGSSTMALCSDGGVVTWGDNFYAQLGVPGLVSSFGPVAVSSESVLTGKKALFGAVAYHGLVVLAEPDSQTILPAFASTSLTETTGSSDPDHYGIPNLMEYVLHGDPNSPSTDILPRMVIEGDNFVFRFNRLAASGNDTTQVFQYSTEMVGWTSVVITTPTDSRVNLGAVDGNGDQSVTVTVPKGSNARMFCRLVVSEP